MSMQRYTNTGLGWAVIISAVVAASCATARPPHPSRDNPISGCEIECRGGRKPLFGISHVCPNGHWYQDIRIIGEYILRGADGGILENLWVTDAGNYPKEDVELGMCYIVMKKLNPDGISLHPGEQPPSYPTFQPPK